MSFYQLTINSKPIDENYGDLQDACKAFTTALNSLAAVRASGTVLTIEHLTFACNNPGGLPLAPNALASATVLPAGMYDVTFSYLRFTDGAFEVSSERVV
jgi:hypothetical protein